MEDKTNTNFSNSSFNPDTYLYDEYALRFLRSRLEPFELYCLYMVVEESTNGNGLHKTKIDDYFKYRTKIDNAFVKFDAQGLIIEDKQHRIKNGRPYVLTPRGIQFYQLFKEEIRNIIGGEE